MFASLSSWYFNICHWTLIVLGLTSRTAYLTPWEPNHLSRDFKSIQIIGLDMSAGAKLVVIWITSVTRSSA